MQTKIFEIGDLKNGNNVRWDYPRLQINIPEENASILPPLHSEFEIELNFSEGKIVNNARKEYYDGTFHTVVVNDHRNRFGKGTINAICAIWKDKKGDGILIGWLKDHDIKAGTNVKISRVDGKYYLIPSMFE